MSPQSRIRRCRGAAGAVAAFATALSLTAVALPSAASDKSEWRQLESGLEYTAIPLPSTTEGATLDVVRADLARFRLKLFNASAPGEGNPRTAREWSERHGLALAVNASMYQEDHRTSVSLMRTRDHVNNRRLSKDRTVLAFDRLDSKVPEVQLIDRDCQDFEALGKHYGSLVQSIRMIACDGRNVWSKDARRTSIVCLGMDRRGRLVFVLARAPIGPHDLIEVLKRRPLELRSAMYLEGGPEAQLFVRAGGKELNLTGGGEPPFLPSARKPAAWRIPNVLGLERRKK